MFASQFKTLLLTSMLAFSAASAHADVITFENIAASSDESAYSPGKNYVPLAGYNLLPNGTSASVYDSMVLAGFAAYAANGTDYLRLNFGSSVTLTSTAEPLFSINSIDLDNFYYREDSVSDSTATLTGTFADGITISKTFVLSNNNIVLTNDFTTEMLSGFTNLTSFKIAASGSLLAIDNIVVAQGATANAVVPEPASLAILGLGLVGIAAARRRKSA